MIQRFDIAISRFVLRTDVGYYRLRGDISWIYYASKVQSAYNVLEVYPVYLCDSLSIWHLSGMKSEQDIFFVYSRESHKWLCILYALFPQKFLVSAITVYYYRLWQKHAEILTALSVILDYLDVDPHANKTFCKIISRLATAYYHCVLHLICLHTEILKERSWKISLGAKWDNIILFHCEIARWNIYFPFSLNNTYKQACCRFTTKLSDRSADKRIALRYLILYKLSLTICKGVYLKSCWQTKYSWRFSWSLKFRIYDHCKTKLLS